MRMVIVAIDPRSKLHKRQIYRVTILVFDADLACRYVLSFFSDLSRIFFSLEASCCANFSSVVSKSIFVFHVYSRPGLNYTTITCSLLNKLINSVAPPTL